MPSILYFALIGLSMIWGFSFLFIKILLSYFNPFTIVFFRSFVGVLVIISIMILKKKDIFPKKKSLLLLILVGLTNAAIPWVLIGFSETLISSSMASIMNATTPLWTVLIGILFFKTKIRPLQWAGIITGFIGILFLMGIDFNNLLNGNIYGYLGMVMSSMCYGMAAQLIRNYLQDLSIYQIALYTLLVSSIVSFILSMSVGSINWLYFTQYKVITAVVGLGVFGSGMAFIIYNYLIQKGSAEFASLVTYLVPVSAMFWGMTLLGEEIKWNMVAGLVLILLGVFITSRMGKKDQNHLTG